jgi:hypothetical protein
VSDLASSGAAMTRWLRRKPNQFRWLAIPASGPSLSRVDDPEGTVDELLDERLNEHVPMTFLELEPPQGREKKASPADRQDGPSRKNQSRPASVRKVAAPSALRNGTWNRSDRWLAQ